VTHSHGQLSRRSLVKRHKLAGSHPGTLEPTKCRNRLMMLVYTVVPWPTRLTRVTHSHGQLSCRSLVKRHKLAGGHPGTKNRMIMLVSTTVD
jgi:hypothetical protein